MINVSSSEPIPTAYPVVICGRRVLVTRYHLGSHPGVEKGYTRAQQVGWREGGQYRPVGCPNECVALADGAVQLSRHAKVDQLDVSVVCEENVLSFDVAMDHLTLVKVAEALQEGGRRVWWASSGSGTTGEQTRLND